MNKPPLKLGTKTRWGKIGMVGLTGGERYYWMVDKNKGVTMLPWFVVESLAKRTQSKRLNQKKSTNPQGAG